MMFIVKDQAFNRISPCFCFAVLESSVELFAATQPAGNYAVLSLSNIRKYPMKRGANRLPFLLSEK